MRILITCPPMIRSIEQVKHRFTAAGIEHVCPEIVQTLTEEQLIAILPDFDGWIIGDDPATKRVLEAGMKGRLRGCVKWGVGTDNVDLIGARALGLDIKNTPGAFGSEVADIAMHYVVALARGTYEINRGVRAGRWPKPIGMSLAGKTVALVGFGDIGRNCAKRFLASDMKVIAYDPTFAPVPGLDPIEHVQWPDRIEEADFVVLACALTRDTHHLLNAKIFVRLKRGVRIVNVSRGPLIDELALAAQVRDGSVHSVALEVFEQEPLPEDSPLRSCENCIFGSHNASNTSEAVVRTSERAIQLIFAALGITQ